MSRIVKIASGFLLTMVLAFLVSSFVVTEKRTEREKWLSQEWKMWKVEEDGQEVEPTYSRFILTLKKNFTFVITKEYEMTHRGTWDYTNGKLTLSDKVTNKDIVLPVEQLDESHLVFSGYESDKRSTYLTPVSNKDAIH